MCWGRQLCCLNALRDALLGGPFVLLDAPALTLFVHTLNHDDRLAYGRLMCIFRREGFVAMVKGVVSEAVPDKGSGYSSNLGAVVKRRLSG